MSVTIITSIAIKVLIIIPTALNNKLIISYGLEVELDELATFCYYKGKVALLTQRSSA